MDGVKNLILSGANAMNQGPSYDTRNGKREMPPGAPRAPMEAKIIFDPEKGLLKIEGAESFKSWAFFGAVCGMAQDLAKFNNSIAMGQQIQNLQIEEALRQQAAAQEARKIEGITLGKH